LWACSKAISPAGRVFLRGSMMKRRAIRNSFQVLRQVMTMMVATAGLATGRRIWQ
jgi:hypothetical protein